MDRLTSLLTLALLLGISSVANAQTVTLTVAGDVDQADTLELGSQPVYLQDLLKSAGIHGDGSAVILRGDSLRFAYSEFISVHSAGHQSHLKNGDIVVFHQVSGSARTDGHIVVIADIPRIVPLGLIDGRLANLLAAFNIAANPSDQIRMIRTDGGSAVSREVRPDETLIHGDVVQLNAFAAIDPIQIRRLFGNPIADAGSSSGSGVSVPSPAVRTVASEEEGVHEFPESAQALELTLPPIDADMAAVQEPSSRISVIPAAAETVLADPPETVAPVVDTVDAGPSDADIAGDSYTEAEVSPYWNAVFIIGLLGSLTLVVTGWLKTRREAAFSQTQMFESGNQLRVPPEIPAPSASIAASWVARDQLPSSAFSSEESTFNDSLPTVFGESGDSFAPVVDRETDSSSVPPMTNAKDRLVQDQEWLGGDWRDRVSEITAPVETGQAPEPAPAPQPKAPPIKPLVSAAPPAPEMPSPRPVEPPMAEEPAAVMESADDLEDLIQNRLPVELRQADLPLKVTLFGRPAGPRRLRIDAAHTEIAAPNFAAGRRTAGQQPVSSASTSQSADRDAAASLDRALNSLKEQGQ